MKHVRHFYSTHKKTEQNGQSQQWYSISNYHSETLIAHRQGQLVLSLHHPLAQNRKANLQLRFAREAVFGHVARSGRQLFAKQPLQPCVALIWRTQLCPHLVHGHVRELHVLELWLCQQPTLQGQPNSSSWGRHFASVDELSSSGTGSKLQMPCEQPTSAQCLLISNSSTGHVVGIECQEMWMPLEGRPL